MFLIFFLIFNWYQSRRRPWIWFNLKPKVAAPSAWLNIATVKLVLLISRRLIEIETWNLAQMLPAAYGSICLTLGPRWYCKQIYNDCCSLQCFVHITGWKPRLETWTWAFTLDMIQWISCHPYNHITMLEYSSNSRSSIQIARGSWAVRLKAIFCYLC